MMKALRLSVALLSLSLAAGAALPACGAGEPAEVHLEGQSEVFPGFDYSTGLQPAASPVQASFSVSAGGAIKVQADAAVSGSEDEPLLTGLPDTGTLAVEGGFALVGQLKIDVSGLPSYDGPIPGIENVTIPFGASTAFDPFSIDESVSARAAIPPSRLPGIPLPGGIPGQLVLEVAEGSFVEVSFTGSCAGIDDDEALYSGRVDRSGALVVKPIIEIEVPILGTQSYEIPSFTVDLALGQSELAMSADVDAYGAEPEEGDGQDDTCKPGGGAGGAGATASGGSGGGGPGGGGPGSTGPGGSGGTSHANLTIDSVAMDVTGIDLWPAGSVDAYSHVFVSFTGPGFAAGSDFVVDVATTGTGCGTGSRFILRPDVNNASYPDQYWSDGTADCGLQITSDAMAPGEHVTGTFIGWLDALQQGTVPDYAHVAASFDVTSP